ncbi:hypothetical protein [uncultured Methylobacterium sp.]|uniref:hypothetical protein n=1 Tax=uncultured Methylobacterium sp. TaxID=157278 RepID=UPI0035CC1020
MPDFILILVAATVFCLAVVLLNALTGLAIGLKVAPADLSENGLLQYGLALVVAHLTWRFAARRVVA